MPKEILLTRGLVTIVDDDDFLRLSVFNWSAHSSGYAKTNIRTETGRFKTVFMHRLLLNAPKGLSVDHIDGNPFNNQKENLRLCTRQENSRNRRLSILNTSGYVGVFADRSTNKWRSNITFQGKRHYLGYFDDPIEAARAYNSKALELFGEFARLNVV